jgi:hypothetical protein
VNSKQKGARGEREITIDTCQPIPSKTGEQTLQERTIMHMHKDTPVQNDADLKEYKIELERRRQIGLTIDPAAAETTFWWADVGDPYGILDATYDLGQSGREYFARNPGGEWVHFHDLPEATRKALWERDKRKLAFPYGLNPSDDIINKPRQKGIA